MLFLVLFAAGIGSGYLVLKSDIFHKDTSGVAVQNVEQISVAKPSDGITIYFPLSGALQIEQRKITINGTRADMARMVLAEFLKGPSGATAPAFMSGVAINGIFFGSDDILYVDLSGIIKANFKGDAYTEYMLIQALYNSIMKNVSGLRDVKIVIDGVETETLGGHIRINRPLGETVSFIN